VNVLTTATIAAILSISCTPEPTLTPACEYVKSLGEIRAEATRKLHKERGKGKLDYSP